MSKQRPPRNTATQITGPEAVAAFAAARAELAAVPGRSERRALLADLLDGRLKVFLDALPDLDDTHRAEIIEAAGEFAAGLGRSDARALNDLPALTRLKWHLARRRLTVELVKVVRYQRGKSDPAIVRNPIRRYVVLPYWKDDNLKIPQQVYLARDEVAARGQVKDVAWTDGRLVLNGDAFIHSVSNARKWTAIKTVLLRQAGSHRSIRLLARQVARRSGRWTGFSVTIDPKRLRTRGQWRDGVWHLDAAIFNAGVYRRAALRGGSTGSAANPPYHYVTDNVRIVPEVEEGAFTIRVETVRALATALAWSGDTLTVTGTLAEPATSLSLSCDDVTVTVPATWSEGRFTASVHLAELPVAETEDLSAVDDTMRWQVAVQTAQASYRLVAAEDLEAARTLNAGREAVAERGVGGYLRVGVRTARLVVTDVALASDAVLRLTAEHPLATSGQIVLRGPESRSEYAFELRAEDKKLTAEIPLAAVPSLAGVLPLRQGSWDLLFRETPRGRSLAVSLADSTADELPATTEVDYRSFTLHNLDGHLLLRTSGNLKPDELGTTTKMREEARRQVARTGLREAVLFSCFNGRLYADSTRAIHEELARRHPDLEQLWVVADGQVELPPTAKAVRLNGRDWHEALASSRYIVTNHRFGDWFQRHPDQTVLQTWHGTPLKKIGHDVKEVHFAYAPGMRKALQSAALPNLPEWTHLVSPNPFSTEILRRAFAFKGEIIEAGYPRNDLLYSADAEAIAASVRARIGIPGGKKVVLYAPTWRDDQFYGRGRYKLDWRIDLEHFRRVLGDDHVLLVRLHPTVVDAPPADDLVYNVSAYPDITDLYLAADVLVSDYSSVMFDFANTRKPQLFFTYDLAHYRDTLRGFYFDFEAEAPGPLVATSSDLIEALRDVDSVAAEYQPAYEAFYERFCSLEDGKAAARVIDRVFPF